MAENYLITGYWGEPHVTAENDRGINAAIFGTGRFVLPVGEMFRAEYIGNNTIRMYDGKLLNNGAAAGIPAGQYVDFTIPEAGQGTSRNDLIVFTYAKDLGTLKETGWFSVVRGTETSGTPTDPALSENDQILSDNADFDQMALWRIPVSGATIGTPEQVFNTRFAGERIATAHSDDGASYTADLPGICNLYNGLEVTIIPNIANTSSTVTLDLNGLGAKNVRVPLSFNTAALNAPDESYFGSGRAVRLMFDAAYLAGKGAWKVVGMQKTSAQDLYGDVPVQSGGIAINTTSTDEDIATAKERIYSILGMTEDDIASKIFVVNYDGTAPDKTFNEILEAYNAGKLCLLWDKSKNTVACIKSVSSTIISFRELTNNFSCTVYNFSANHPTEASRGSSNNYPVHKTTLSYNSNTFSVDNDAANIHSAFTAGKHCVLVRGGDVYNLTSSDGTTCMFERTRYVPAADDYTVTTIIEQVLLGLFSEDGTSVPILIQQYKFDATSTVVVNGSIVRPGYE